MPTYDYVCSRCGHRSEVVHGIHGHGPKACPSCGTVGAMSKAFVPPVVHFKGSGWAKKDRSATSTPAKGPSGPASIASSASAEKGSSTGESGAAPTTASNGDGAAGATSD